MAENVSHFFRRARQKLHAARLLAEDELTDREVAARAGVSERQLYRWKREPAFAARVRALVAELGELSTRRAIGRRARRLRALDERWQALQRVAAERGADPGMAGVPGGATGLLVRTVRGVGSGPNFRVVEEYEVDAALLRELRDHERQAAQELGQWVEKLAPTSPDGEEPYRATDDEARAIVAAALARLGLELGAAGGGGPPGPDGPALGPPGGPAAGGGDGGLPLAEFGPALPGPGDHAPGQPPGG